MMSLTKIKRKIRGVTIAKLYDVCSADEAFVTGTFGGLTPVRHIDGKFIGDFNLTITQRLQALYYDMITAF